MQKIDTESVAFLKQLECEEKTRKNLVTGAKAVLIVLSSRGMVYDVEALRQNVLLVYPDAKVFFRTTQGKSIGVACPSRVDLLIDFTGPGQRQGWFYSRKLRGMAKVAVGRNAGLFRAKIYNRVFDEKKNMKQLPKDLLAREREVQKEVLALAGIPLALQGDTPPDIGQSIALKLPAMSRL